MPRSWLYHGGCRTTNWLLENFDLFKETIDERICCERSLVEVLVDNLSLRGPDCLKGHNHSSVLLLLHRFIHGEEPSFGIHALVSADVLNYILAR